MANVQVIQRHAHLASAVKLEFVNGREGKLAKALLTAISNQYRGSGEDREKRAVAIQWTPAQRLLALHESHALQGPALHAWCRERGLFEHQLIQWREIFCTATQPAAVSAAEQRAANTAMRELQSRHDQLQRQMRRKDRALAEAAALLVLQKKFQALVLQQSEDEDK